MIRPLRPFSSSSPSLPSHHIRHDELVVQNRQTQQNSKRKSINSSRMRREGKFGHRQPTEPHESELTFEPPPPTVRFTLNLGQSFLFLSLFIYSLSSPRTPWFRIPRGSIIKRPLDSHNVTSWGLAKIKGGQNNFFFYLSSLSSSSPPMSHKWRLSHSKTFPPTTLPIQLDREGNIKENKKKKHRVTTINGRWRRSGLAGVPFPSRESVSSTNLRFFFFFYWQASYDDLTPAIIGWWWRLVKETPRVLYENRVKYEETDGVICSPLSLSHFTSYFGRMYLLVLANNQEEEDMWELSFPNRERGGR